MQLTNDGSHAESCRRVLYSWEATPLRRDMMIHRHLTSLVLCTDKKQKRKKGRVADEGVAEEALTVVLFEDEAEQLPVNPDMPNLDAWRPGRGLQIGDSKFSVVYNPPTADKVQPKPHLRCCSVLLAPLQIPV